MHPAVFLIALVPAAFAAPAAPEPETAQPVRLLSINPAHPDDDLTPIIDAIADARVVVLAAATDGDGAAHWARTRLAKALIERAGFSVIAFEAGFYDCWAMNQQLAAGTDASVVAPLGLPEEFARSAYLTDLVHDAWRSYFNPQHTDICGYDYRHTGSRTARQLPRSFLEYLAAVDPHPLTKDQRRDYLTVLERLAEARDADDDAAVVRSWEQLHELRAVLTAHREALIEAQGQSVYDTWDRVMADAVRHAEDALAFDAEDETLAADNTRQAHVGERLVWLADAVYPERRIIVFASTLTAIAEPAQLSVEPDADLLTGYRSAGGAWGAAFGDHLYTIAFTAERGVSGWIQGPGFPVPDAIAGSVEARLATEDWPFLFIDLTGGPARRAGRAPDPWWASPRPSTLTGLNRVLAYREQLPRQQRVTAVWPDQVDAVFFIEQMFPNHWKPEPPEGVPHTIAIE